MAKQRFWTLRVVQEYVMLADSADAVLEAMEKLEHRAAEGMSLVAHASHAAPTTTTGDPASREPA